MNLLWLSVKNLKRNRYWTVITVLISAIAIGSIFTSFIILNGINFSLEIGRERLGADLVVFPSGEQASMINALQSGAPALFYMKKEMADKVRNVDGIEKASPELYLMTLSRSCCSLGLPFRVVGFDPGNDFSITPWMIKHRINSLASNEVVIGSDVPSTKGEHAKILTKDFVVAGVLERTGIGFDKTIYMMLDSARGLGKNLNITYRENEISSILVKIKDGYDPAQVASQIKKTLPGVEVMGSSQLNRSIKTIFDRMLVMVGLIFTVILVLGCVSISGVFYAMTRTRQAEIGILRSIGAKRKDIFTLIVLESVISSCVGGAIGIVIAIFLIADFNILLAKSLPFPFVLNPGGIISVGSFCIILSALIGLIGSIYPGRKSSMIDPFEAIRKGA